MLQHAAQIACYSMLFRILTMMIHLCMFVMSSVQCILETNYKMMSKNYTACCSMLLWTKTACCSMLSKIHVLSPKNGTTFFLAYFLTLEYILEIFRAQLTNIFKKNARGEKRVCFPRPVSNIPRFAHDVYSFPN